MTEQELIEAVVARGMFGGWDEEGQVYRDIERLAREVERLNEQVGTHMMYEQDELEPRIERLRAVARAANDPALFGTQELAEIFDALQPGDLGGEADA